MQNRISGQSAEKPRNLRKNQTTFESILWQHLRNKRLNNLKFRRQEPIGFYIADFVCIEKKVAVELDGAHHFVGDQLMYDQERNQFMYDLGYKVLRFKNSEVIEDLDGLLGKIKVACGV